MNALRASADWTVTALLYAHGKRLSDWARDMLREMDACFHLACDEALMTELSDKDDTSEILAVVDLPRIDECHLSLRETDLVVVLDRPGNPGNLGSIIRSCDALGCCGVAITGHAVDPFDPVVIRAAAGSFFSVKIARLQSHKDFSEWIAGVRNDLPNLQIVGTSAHAETAPWQNDFTRPTILVMGSETRGLSAWMKERCDSMVRIDMTGTASSLNLACATTAFLYEVQRQRAGQ